MPQGTVFENNRTQTVTLPLSTRFPANVKKVNVRAAGKERILTPIHNMWDRFFLSDANVSDDFMPERANQEQSDRDAF